MQLGDIKKHKQQLYQIAAKHGISKLYVFGAGQIVLRVIAARRLIKS